MLIRICQGNKIIRTMEMPTEIKRDCGSNHDIMWAGYFMVRDLGYKVREIEWFNVGYIYDVR